MICPKCSKDTMHKATPREKKLMTPLIQEWDIANDDLYIMVCVCGWFETLHNFDSWGDWYERARVALQKIA